MFNCNCTQTLRLRRGLFSAAGQQQRRRQQPYQAFFHGKPSLSGRLSVIPTSICLSRCPPRTVMRLAEFAARRPRIVFHPFFAAAPPKGTSVGRVRREKYFARRECVFAHFCVKTHGSERNLFCQKRQRPFLTSSYYPSTQAFRALPSGSSTRRPSVTLTSGAAARISATDVSMPLLPLVQKGRMVFPVRS